MVKMKEQIITSKNNHFIKELSKLTNKKYRYKLGLVILEGKKIINECLIRNKDIKFLIVLDAFKDKYQDIINKLNQSNCKTYIVPKQIFEQLSNTVNSQGIIAVTEFIEKKFELPKTNFLILDNISDPGNLGTIIRTAMACGFEYIYTYNCVDEYNDKVLRSTMGTIFDCNIIKVAFENIKQLSEQFSLLVAEMNSLNIFNCEIKNEITGIVIGNEGNGVSKEVFDLSSLKVSLPMLNNVESLNASVACAVLMYAVNSKQNKF